MSKRFQFSEESSSSSSYKVSNPLFNWIKSKKDESHIQIAETFDIQSDYDKFQNHSLGIFKPEILYEKSNWFSKDRFLTQSEERSIRVGDNDEFISSIFNQDRCKVLSRKSPSNLYTHTGMIILGLKGMTRSHIGAKVFACIFDSSIIDAKKKLIVSMEVDMDQNRGLFYCTPDIFMKTCDLHFIKLAIFSRGYGVIERDNLNITVGFLGKLSRSSNTKFKCNVSKILDAVASKGVKFIEAPILSRSIYNNQNWDLSSVLNSNKNTVNQPTSGTLFDDLKGKISIVFDNYENTILNEDDDDITESI